MISEIRLIKRLLASVAFLLFAQSVIAQNVGIGTITPAFKLDVQGRMRVKTGTLNTINTSSGIWLEDYRDGSNRFFIGMQDSIRFGFYGEGTNTVGWGLNFNARTGNMGVGRIATTSKLEINDEFGGDVGFYHDNGFIGRIRVSDSTMQISAGTGSSLCSPNPCPAKNIILHPVASGLVPIGTTYGRVGIGLNDPVEKLDLKGNMRIEASSNTVPAYIKLYGGTDDLSYIQFYNNLNAPTAMGYIGYSGSGDYSIWNKGTSVFLNGDGMGISNSAPLTRLHISSGQDAGLGSANNGFIMLGPGTSSNIIIDNNELMARNNGAAAELTFQNDGGTVRIGNVAVPTGYRFAIDGKAICEELKVQLSGNWPDYVFQNNYNLKSFDELRKYIAVNKHLPNIPAAAEVEKNGMEVGDMQKRMMEKIEELTLYVLQLEEKISDLQKKIENK